MEISPTLAVISAIAPKSQDSTGSQPQTEVTGQPDLSQPTDGGTPSVNDLNSPVGNLLNTEA